MNLTPARRLTGDVLSALRGNVRVPLLPLRRALSGLGDHVRIDLEESDGGVLVRGEAEAFRAPLRFSVRVEIGGLRVDGDARVVSLRLHDATLHTTPEAPGPLAAAIRDGSLDPSRPGDLVGNMLGLPPFVHAAHGDLVELDLAKLPGLDATIPRALFGVGTTLLTVERVTARGDALELGLRVLPAGPAAPARTFLRHVVVPALGRLATPKNRPGVPS